MKYYIKKADTFHELEIQEKDGYLVIRNGKKHHRVDLKPTDDQTFSIIIDNFSYTVGAEFRDQHIRLFMEQHACDIQVFNERQKLESEIFGNSELKAHGGEIVAPMPGMILRIEVEEGQKVVTGQPLLVMEAMKMENEIRASRDGMVSKILVQPSQAVEKDDVLITLQ